VKPVHALLIGALAVVFLPQPVLAEEGFEPREFMVDVHPNLKFSGLSADERVLVFDRPVQIPGARLSAGAYIFRMVAPSFLQVIDASRRKVYATFIVIPIYTREGNNNGLDRVAFQDTGEDESLRIVAWYHADGNGFKFKYPKPKGKPLDRREQ
jgi:hypothetical protein